MPFPNARGQKPAATATQATTVPILLPSGLAYDGTGNLFFAETGSQVIRRVSPAGVLTTVAGTGVQGFAGDGGLAAAALLDSPAALALDASGNLFFADTHNHRIRRIDAVSAIITTVAGTGATSLGPDGAAAIATAIDTPSALALDAAQNLFYSDARTHIIRRIDHGTGRVTTVAGNGQEGFSGDGGSALAACIDTPSGLAFDVSGNLFVSDSHNQRIRRIAFNANGIGTISTVAGSGLRGFSGDSAAASSAALNLPRGLALDASGNLLFADSDNHRIRRISAATGAITTIAGDGTQSFSGDASPALSASLDTPRAVMFSASGLPTLADTANQRVRQVDTAAIIHTVAGLGTTTASTLTLSAPTVVAYGTGTLTATLIASAATGPVTFFDTSSGTAQTLASVLLSGNTASLSTSTMDATAHRLSATYSGDTLHSAALSNTLTLTVSPAALLATPNSVTLLYGQPIPPLTGTLTGVLPQDNSAVTLNLSSFALPLSPAASYPIAASISGPSARNYTLTAAPAAITIAKAPSSITLSTGLAVHVASSTAGAPGGNVRLLDGANTYASATLSATGDAIFSSANLAVGSHTLTAVYSGDADFLAASSAPTIVTIGPALAPDFSFTATGQTSVTVPAGTPAAFSFAVNPINGALSSPILLAASGLPTGATASFNPAYLPPAGTPSAFILTIQTTTSAQLASPRHPSAWLFATLLPLGFFLRRHRRRAVALLMLPVLLLGCGDRINNSASTSAAVRAYNITVSGTATASSGGTLQHTATVTLNLQ